MHTFRTAPYRDPRHRPRPPAYGSPTYWAIRQKCQGFNDELPSMQTPAATILMMMVMGMMVMMMTMVAMMMGM